MIFFAATEQLLQISVFFVPILGIEGGDIFLADRKFTEAHLDFLVKSLGLEGPDELIKEIEKTYHALPNKDGICGLRSLGSYIQGKSNGQKKTRKTTLIILFELGITATEDWLDSDGSAPPIGQITIPDLASSRVRISPSDQMEIANILGGCYAVYRRYAARNSLLVRELLWFDKNPSLNSRVLLLNREGFAYEGFGYRCRFVVYVYLFRPDRNVAFSSRSLYIATPERGSGRTLGALLHRIRATSSQGSAQDCILVPIEDEITEQRLVEIADNLEERQQGGLDPIDLGQAISEWIRPRSFDSEDEMSEQEKIIYQDLRPFLRVKTADEIADLGLVALKK